MIALFDKLPDEIAMGRMTSNADSEAARRSRISLA